MPGPRMLLFVVGLALGLDATACGGGRFYDPAARTVSCTARGFGEPCVARGIDGRRTRIRACYESELARAPTLEGQLTIELTVEPDGETTGVHASDDTLSSPIVRDCVLAVLDDMRFTPPPAEGTPTFSFPFVFQPR